MDQRSPEREKERDEDEDEDEAGAGARARARAKGRGSSKEHRDETGEPVKKASPKRLAAAKKPRGRPVEADPKAGDDESERPEGHTKRARVGGPAPPGPEVKGKRKGPQDGSESSKSSRVADLVPAESGSEVRAKACDRKLFSCFFWSGRCACWVDRAGEAAVRL